MTRSNYCQIDAGVRYRPDYHAAERFALVDIDLDVVIVSTKYSLLACVLIGAKTLMIRSVPLPDACIMIAAAVTEKQTSKK
jgi:hypothetical protein